MAVPAVGQWLDKYFKTGVKSVLIGGVPIPLPAGAAAILANFASGVTGAYNATTGNVDLTVTVPAPATNANGVYGDGSDGTVTFDGSTTILGMAPSSNTYTLTRDLYLAGGTVNTGVTILTAGYRIFCSGILGGSGYISTDGASGAAGGVGGGAVGPTVATLGWSTSGGAGNGPGQNNAMGGTGGNCSFGTTGLAAVRPSATLGAPRNIVDAVHGYLFVGGGSGGAATIMNGGCAGAGASTAIGGGGGGVCVVVAMTLSGSLTISSNGGAGMDDGTYSSGGGGGGFLVVVSRNATAWTGTATATGGVKGGSRAGATAGSSGTVLQLTA